MADTKITALTAITTVDPAVDVLPIVDVSDTTMAASGTTKKITSNQILGAGGTATLASATITGDLTVDTSTLKVDSANNYVGIGTASPVQSLTISGEASLRVGDLFYWNAYYNAGFKARAAGYAAFISEDGSGDFTIANTASSAAGAGSSLSFLVRNRITNSGVCTWENVGGVAGTAMTLNSTGLGVGMSPSAALSVLKSSATQATGLILRNGNGADGSSISLDFETSSGTSGQEATLAGRISGRRVGGGTTGALDFFVTNAGTLGSAKMTIDSTGNVGIGVAPSAWATYKGLQVGYASLAGYAGSDTLLGSNVYFDGGAFRYISTATASSYRQLSGVHSWSTAPSGTAGSAITFTQAMTLDASGNLLVKKTSASGTTLGVELLATGQINGATAGADNLNIYNTTAAAYRFYVSAAGTIFATNTTISAISDARLKENVQDIDAGLGAILALKPRKFDWKAGKGKDIKGDRGFIAQEFEQVFPDLIDTWKDPAPEGEAPYKSVRQDLIPVLVKAIQELTARVEALEA